MEEITIRKASLNDLETLHRFEQGVINAERPFDPTLKKESTSYYNLEEMITASHIELVVAQAGDEIVGSGYARIETSKPYLYHQKHSYMGFMYVEPRFRGTGINQKIIEALVQWSLSRGVHEMRLQVYVDNAAAISAYEKVGFSKHMLEMRMGLDQ